MPFEGQLKIILENFHLDNIGTGFLSAMSFVNVMSHAD